MSIRQNDTGARARAAHEALRSGDARRARELYGNLVEEGSGDPTVLLGLAYASRSLKDDEVKVAAVDRVLAIEPRNVRALILKADHLAATGDARAASSFYTAAVKVAPPSNQTPPDLAQELRRARQMCEQYAAQYKSYLRDRLADKLSHVGRAGERFSQSLDILFGEKQIYLQQPRYYFFPGLPQVQFYDRAAFSWLGALEAATDDIRAELIEVMKDGGTFKPYVQGDPNRPRKEQDGMLDNPDWSAFYLWKNGEVIPEHAARCPKTLRALEGTPLARVPNRSPSILFSLLRAGAHIPPHNGFVNTRLICHLPLIVPPRCRFRVGNEVRDWLEGKAWLFDDTIEHEAWNGSDRTRVILLFDVWRPELSLQERELVVALFDAIDAHTGTKPYWEI